MVETGELVELEPEFSLMSRRPGIGEKWYKKYSSDLWPDDFVVMDNGKTYPVPKYYLRLLEKENPELYQEIKAARKERAKEHEPESGLREMQKNTAKELRIKTLKRGLR